MLGGGLLVLATWGALTIAVLALGVPMARAVAGPVSRRQLVRAGLWWGLLGWMLIAGGLSLMGPLRSTFAAVFCGVVAIAMSVPAVVILRRGITGRAATVDAWPLWFRRALLVPSGLGLGYLAVAALGPATNYDTGLYHLGAIRYVAEFGTVPGLANLYFGYGYANAQFPLAALLTNSPWTNDGWRLLNGFVMLLLATELWLRLRERRRSPGTYLLIPSLALVLVAFGALSDYWVTSPTSDTSVLLITLAYLAAMTDVIAGRPLRVGASIMIATGVMLAMLRPTTVVLTLAGFLAVGVIARRDGQRLARPALVAVLVGVLALVIAGARDRILSGWLQYPLSVYAFEVPWRAADPVGNRLATLGTARDADNLWTAAEGYDWLGVWATRLPGQWEFWAFTALLVAAGVMLWCARGDVRWRRLLLALAPPTLGGIVWLLFSPPSFRFGWGTVFGVPLIALGWALWRSSARFGSRLMRLVALGFSVAVLISLTVSVGWRFDSSALRGSVTLHAGPISVRVPVAAVPEAPFVQTTTKSGLTLLVPTQSDQCWATYPLCTPQPDGSLRLVGDELASGLTLERA